MAILLPIILAIAGLFVVVKLFRFYYRESSITDRLQSMDVYELLDLVLKKEITTLDVPKDKRPEVENLLSDIGKQID